MVFAAVAAPLTAARTHTILRFLYSTSVTGDVAALAALTLLTDM